MNGISALIRRGQAKGLCPGGPRGPQPTLGVWGEHPCPGSLKRQSPTVGDPLLSLVDVCGSHGRALTTPLEALHTQPPAHSRLSLGSRTSLPAPPAALVQAHHRAVACTISACARSPLVRSSYQTAQTLPSLTARPQHHCHHITDLPLYLSWSNFMLYTTCFFFFLNIFIGV